MPLHLGAPAHVKLNAQVGWSREEWMTRLKSSTTVYVDNLSFYTAEEQVHFFFSQVGLVKKVIMGLNRYTFRPAGFCFVECAPLYALAYSTTKPPPGTTSDSTLWTPCAPAMAPP